MPYRMPRVNWSYLVEPTSRGIAHLGRMGALRQQTHMRQLESIGRTGNLRRREEQQQRQFDARQAQQQDQFDARQQLLGRGQDRLERALDFQIAQAHEDKLERQARVENATRRLEAFGYVAKEQVAAGGQVSPEVLAGIEKEKRTVTTAAAQQRKEEGG